jgi:hypothetical protein
LLTRLSRPLMNLLVPVHPTVFRGRVGSDPIERRSHTHAPIGLLRNRIAKPSIERTLANKKRAAGEREGRHDVGGMP